MHPSRLPILTCAVLGMAILFPPCAAAPGTLPQIGSRFASCDPATAGAAVKAALNDPATLLDPSVLFDAAVAEHIADHKDQAAFMYLAARLRMSRQALVGRDEATQALAAMVVTISPIILPDLLLDPDMARRTVERVIDWDRATPDPFRDQAMSKGGKFPAKLAEIDGALARLPSDIPGQLAKIEAFIREYPSMARPGGARALILADGEQQLARWRDGRCRAGEPQ